MAFIKVSIKDKNTLELQEDAKKGDVIDLSALSTADVGAVSDAVKSAAKKEAEREFEILKAREIEAELLRQEKALKEKHQAALIALEAEKTKFDLIAQKQEDEIQRLKNERQQAIENEKKLKAIEINNSVMEKDKAIISLQSELEKKDNAIKFELERKAVEIKILNDKIAHQEKERALESQRILQDIVNEKEKLANALKTSDTEHKLNEQKNKEFYERLLKDKEQEIEHYKNMKAKLNTKLIGQTLEDHCEIEFEQKVRPFVSKNVSFGKDNDSVDGTKGDYIFCEKDENDVEIISIMFEMKNEEEGGLSSKKKNDDFLKKLNDDRIKKNCEYAVLVSMLEADNDLYNGGIVDKSHKYEKMYVIRPQFFVPMITLLRNAAMKVVSLKNELTVIKEQNTDITKFEDDLKEFKNAFGKNAGLFKNKIADAIERLEKQKKQIQDVIDLFIGGQKQLDWAGDKLDNLSVKKLTRGNPTMAAKFEEIKLLKMKDNQEAN